MPAKAIAKLIITNKMTLAAAESVTGGLISHLLTNIPGSSRYFLLGVVAYSNGAKTKLLHVPAETIKKHGAVSKETAIALARNIKHIAHSDAGIGVTGIAGPGGGTPEKPVGTVFISISLRRKTYFKKFKFSGNRQAIKKAAAEAALRLLQRVCCEIPFPVILTLSMAKGKDLIGAKILRPSASE